MISKKEWLYNPPGGLYSLFQSDKLITIANPVTSPAALLRGISLKRPFAGGFLMILQAVKHRAGFHQKGCRQMKDHSRNGRICRL